MTIPVFLFFLALLSSADAVFKHFVTNALNVDFNIQEDVVAQIWWTVFFAVIWLGAYTYILEHANKEEVSVSPVVSRRGLGNIESGILFATLNALFITFVSVQIRYFFAGHDAVTKLGYTYAEYAHKGFGELVFVAIFTFALIFLAERYVERNDANKPSVVFKSLTSVLIWTPAFENYTFREKDGGTELLVDMDTNEEYKQMFEEMWPKALQSLKEIAEK